MALTPEDVVNKRFQPTKFREGYDQDEVDDFLDEIVVELRRLNQENDDLRRQLSEVSTGTAQNAAVPAPVAASTATEEVREEEKPEEPKVEAPKAEEPGCPAGCRRCTCPAGRHRGVCGGCPRDGAEAS